VAYFLDYVTGQSVGRVAIDGSTLRDAIAKAEQVLHGMGCIRALLRHAPANQSFGDGIGLAGFTPDEGWMIDESPGE